MYFAKRKLPQNFISLTLRTSTSKCKFDIIVSTQKRATEDDIVYAKKKGKMVQPYFLFMTKGLFCVSNIRFLLLCFFEVLNFKSRQKMKEVKD